MKNTFLSLSYCNWSATLANCSVILEKAIETRWNFARSKKQLQHWLQPSQFFSSSIQVSFSSSRVHVSVLSSLQYNTIAVESNVTHMVGRTAWLQTAQALHLSVWVLYMRIHQRPMSVCKWLWTMTRGLAPCCLFSVRGLKSALNSQGSLCPVRAATVQNNRCVDWPVDLQLEPLLKDHETLWPLFFRCNLY